MNQRLKNNNYRKKIFNSLIIKFKIKIIRKNKKLIIIMKSKHLKIIFKRKI
jgi:hypothetical protein